MFKALERIRVRRSQIGGARNRRAPLAIGIVAAALVSMLGVAAPADAATTTVVPVSIYVTTTAETASSDQATVEQQVRNEFQGMSDYWFSMSNELVRFDLKQLVYSPGEGICGNKNPDLERDAKEATGWPGADRGESLIISVAAGCSFRGSATSADTLTGGARAYLEGLWDGVWAHEMGHTMGFGHANLLDCPADVVDGRLAAEGGTCVSAGYEDPYEVMGGSYERAYKNFSTPNQIRSGILTADDYVDVDSATSVDQTVTIEAREATSGLRSLEFTDPATDITYWAELATPTRYDSGYIAGDHDSVVDGGDNYLSKRGVRILRMQDASQTLLVSPAGAGDGTRPISWAVGTEFATATGTATLEVVAQTASTATLRLRTTASDTAAPDAPTATSVSGSRIVGTTEPNATVTVKGNGGSTIATATADGDGGFTAALDPAQVPGTSLRITATDVAGNVSTATELTVPAPVPAAPTVYPSDGTVVTGSAEPGSGIAVTVGETLVGSGTTHGDGRFTVPLDPAQTPGTVLKVVASLGDDSASPATTITVTSADAPRELRVELDSVAAGSSQTVHGSGFTPGESVTAVMTSDPIEVGVGTVGSDGTVDVTWTVPADTAVGTHTITLTGSVSGAISTQFAVVAAASSGGGSALAVTGPESVSALIAEALALVLGGLLTMRIKRGARAA